MEKYEINIIFKDLKKTLDNLAKVLQLQKQKKRLKELNNIINHPNFWQDLEKAKNINKEFSDISNKVNKMKIFNQEYQDLYFLMSLETNNQNDFIFVEKELLKLKNNIQDFEINILLNQPYDDKNAILIFHSGAGGVDAQDFCEILFRMYQKYAQKKNFQTEILYYQAGDKAGLKSASLLIKGVNAFGYLKSEKGVHRLVRLSPFDSNSKRHTSFISCEVLPEIDDNIEVNIKEEDLKIDVFRSSGAGGQHVNTTDSAVRITHLPTKIIINYQNERSQNRNKEKALQILKTKLFRMELQKQKNNLQSMKGEQKEIEWGHQIRSYFFHPYKMIKDHRTLCVINQVEDVLDGELDEFIISFLKMDN